MKKNCPYCHAEAPLYFQSKDYNRRVTSERFDHYRCPHCGLIFIDPVPADLSRYYPEIYHAIPATSERLEAVSKHERYKIEIVQRFISQGRLLEIGPSYGSFTYLARKAGFAVDAIEMNAQCCKFLNEVVGVHTINSTDTVAALQDLQPYNVIALWHVIEHLPNPWAALDAIAAKLQPGGILIVASVNPDAFQFRIIGRRWLHLDAPRHVMLIPPKLLAHKLESLGMKVEMITMTDEGTLACNTGGWRYFFHRTCVPLNVNKILRFVVFNVMNLVEKIVQPIVKPIDQLDGMGSAYTMVLRKTVEAAPAADRAEKISTD